MEAQIRWRNVWLKSRLRRCLSEIYGDAGATQEF
jgi:hypothetical protein